MNQIEAMEIYLLVAELNSFTKVANNLSLPKATVSTTIQKLEAQLGTQLLHRTTRKVQMTHDGQVFYERCKDLLADMHELQSMFLPRQAALSGRIRVDMPQSIARNVVIPKLPELMQQHPSLNIELSSTDRKVDLVQEGFDCVLRVGSLHDSNLIARPIEKMRQLNWVSPAYVARYGIPKSLEELKNHYLVHYASTLGARMQEFEYIDHENPQQVNWVKMASNITVNSTDSYLASCLAGLGIIQTPGLAMKKFVAQGELIEILPQYRAPDLPVSLVYLNRRYLPQRVQVFMDWLTSIMQAYLM